MNPSAIHIYSLIEGQVLNSIMKNIFNSLINKFAGKSNSIKVFQYEGITY